MFKELHTAQQVNNVERGTHGVKSVRGYPVLTS